MRNNDFSKNINATKIQHYTSETINCIYGQNLFHLNVQNRKYNRGPSIGIFSFSNKNNPFQKNYR